MNRLLKAYQISLLIPLILSTYVCITPNSDLFFYNGKRIAEISLILFTLIVLSASRSAQNQIIIAYTLLDNTAKNLLLFIFSFGVLSALLSASPQYSFIEIITLFSLFFIALLCASIWRQFPCLIPWLIIALIISFALQEVKFFSYYFAFLLSGNIFSFADFFFTFAHTRFFNQYQIWTLALLTFVLLSHSTLLHDTRLKYTLWVVAISWWGMFFTSNGRGVIVAVIGSYIICYCIFRQKARAFLKLSLLLFISGFLFYQLFFHFIPYLISEQANIAGNTISLPKSLEIRSTSSGRLTHLWPAAIQYIIEHPWLGLGPMQFIASNGRHILLHPHNSALQIASEWGLPVLIAVTVLMYKVLRNWVARFNALSLNVSAGDSNTAIIALTFSISSAIIYSLFSGVIIMPMSQLTGTLVISLAISVYQKNTLLIETSETQHHWSLTLIFSICTISYFWILAPELIPRLLDPMFNSDALMKFDGPRLWLN